jgi:hypothetical protein
MSVPTAGGRNNSTLAVRNKVQKPLNLRHQFHFLSDALNRLRDIQIGLIENAKRLVK